MALDWLNYHHLHYFWVTAREGSLTRAAERLRLAPSTVSTQIKQLEEHLGVSLFERQGRGLALTAAGRLALGYADEIFSLGRELSDAVRFDGAGDATIRLRVGAASILHKLVVYRLLEPALALPDHDVTLSCVEEEPEVLVAELATHHLDLVLTDAPVGIAREVGARTVLLGTCGITVVGTPTLAEAFEPGFPGSLRGAPMLLPAEGTAMRAQIERWFEDHRVAPRVVAEFTDSALMKAFGHQGVGLFVVPSLIVDDVAETYGVRALGELEGLEERLYVISMSRRFTHPAVEAIVTAASRRLASGATG